MLVLSRKEGETIIIGGGIEIQVAAIQGNRVRIAVNAPRSISVMRGELVETEPVATRRTEDEDRPSTVATSHCV